MNKYFNCYLRLIASRKNRVIPVDAYHETHHVIPVSLGGTNSVDNLIDLLPREHFICHLLLAKSYTGRDGMKMALALQFMLAGNTGKRYIPNSRIYQLVRTLTMTKSCGENNSMYGRTGEKSPWFGRTHSEESKLKIGAASKTRIPWNKGKTGVQTVTEETRNKMSQSGKGKTKSIEHRQKIGAAHLGRKRTAEEIALTSGVNHYTKIDGYENTRKGKPDTKVTCPHCDKEGGQSLMKRYHFDNCKFRLTK